MSETERLIGETKQLQTKNEFLQKNNNMLLEENKEQFVNAAGINTDCFICLFNYLNPGED